MLLMILVLILSIGSGLFDERRILYPTTVGDFGETGDYRINSETILESLSQGETDIFFTENRDLDSYTPPGGGTYSWSQADYMKIATALHQFEWGESLEGWRLFRMMFYTNCDDNLNGFAIGDFVFFKPVLRGLAIRYSARETVIHPLVDSVTWGGSRTYPRPLLGWRSIDLTRLTVSADDALKLAERNGGEEARLAVQNGCYVFMSLGMQTGEGWSVMYSQNNGTTLFETLIDPYSGEYKILNADYKSLSGQ